MKSRYSFNATGGSIYLTPSELILEARPRSLRLVRPRARAYLFQLVLIIAISFGYLGVFGLIAGTGFYQAARPWENPSVRWAFMGLFLVGFFVLLFLSEVWGRRVGLRIAEKSPTDADVVRPREILAGRLVQRVVLQTADGRLLRVEVEAAAARFRRALDLAAVSFPLEPVSEEELAALEAARRQAMIVAPGPEGAGRFNTLGVATSVAIAAFLDGLSAWLVVVGNVGFGALGLALFFPLTTYGVYMDARGRRFDCSVCRKLTSFRRGRGSWVCQRCGNSWPIEPATPRAES